VTRDVGRSGRWLQAWVERRGLRLALAETAGGVAKTAAARELICRWFLQLLSWLGRPLVGFQLAAKEAMTSIGRSAKEGAVADVGGAELEVPWARLWVECRVVRHEIRLRTWCAGGGGRGRWAAGRWTVSVWEPTARQGAKGGLQCCLSTAPRPEVACGRCWG
jgi:hypothetical protein